MGIGVAVGLAAVWQDRGPPAKPKAKDSEAGPEVDAEAWQVHLRQRGGDDRAWALKADHAAHYPGPGITRLRAVHLLLKRGDQQPVTADARRGRVTDDRGRITLIEDVILVDPEGYRLTTQRLHYYPEQDRATTDAPVRIQADFGTARAVGATAWTRQRRIRLHNDPKTRFHKVPRDADAGAR